ncbi:alpha/beta fold hydrolase [Rhodopila sp.]|uniref:alpha/beta fold hydrolase n=1 Tax=Rhodopila sp. TaxID=2480087 RepID=UPI002BE654D1|nr:alpha/beta fold hydrolase [Rhodopila sp.]HVZ10103.1 alpha/beta fold hydrolase [Rhodopila sp.]
MSTPFISAQGSSGSSSNRPEAPGPLMRRGPRPLLLHLTLATLRSTVSRATSMHWNAVSPTSSAAAVVDALRRAAADGNRDRPGDAAFSAEVVAETLRQDALLIEGIAAYRRHPYRRTLADPPAVWAEGGSRLLDYGMAGGGMTGGDMTGGGMAGGGKAGGGKPGGGKAGGVPAVFVPSLVNRAYVLDLMEGGSMLRWLAQHGVRPLLLDWGWPGEAERRFTLTDYVAGRLERALGYAASFTGGPTVLVGYCMGGTLAVAAAQRRPDLVRGLGLLAAPWDFHAGDAEQAAQVAAMLPLLEPAMALGNALPVDLLQSLFALLDPWGVAGKYRSFARLPQDGRRARLFVALEDWLNDGIPLAAEVTRACLRDWYGANTPFRGDWRIAGLAVEPRAVTMPAFVAVPAQDRIVPPGAARPLARLIPRAELHEPAAGHIGMAAGSRAETALWQPLAAWIARVAGSGVSGAGARGTGGTGVGGGGPRVPRRRPGARHGTGSAA